MAKQITFVCAFPPIQTAIKITGDGGGMRIQLDIPENQMSEAVKLMLYRQVPLKVTVEVDEQSKVKAAGNNGTTEGNSPRGRTLKRTSTRK